MADIRDFEVTTGSFTFRGRAAGPEDGRLVILLHGFPETSRSWAKVMPALADAGYKVVAPDQRGYSPGARPQGVEHYAVDRLAADVLAIADDIGGHAFDLVGHDWGGAVAWYTAALHPERVRTLTVVSTPHPEAFSRALAGALGGDQAERSWYMDFFRQVGTAEEALLGNDAAGLRNVYTGVDADTIEEYVRVLSEPGALTAALNYYRATSFAAPPPIGAITAPTLYVWSTGDVALGREAAEDTRSHVAGDYRFEVLDGVSHWIPEEAPDRLSALLLQHLSTHT